MLNRRELLQGGIAVTTLPLAARTAWGLPADRPSGTFTPLYKVIYDQRFGPSRAFGAEARRLGAAVAAIRGDITDLWYHELGPLWRATPAAIAGMTAHGPVFCLERLAWDAGMRVVFRTAAGSDEAWGREMARLVTRMPVSAGAASHTALAATEHVEDPQTLVSWVIAPVARANPSIRSAHDAPVQPDPLSRL